MLKLKKGGWLYLLLFLIIGVLVGVVFMFFGGTPPLVSSIQLGLTAALTYSFRNKCFKNAN